MSSSQRPRPRSGPSQPPESQKRSKVEGSQEADSPSSIPVAATDREARLATRNRLRLQAGGDSQGQEVFHSPEALWKQHQDKDGTHDSWYQKAVSYWDNKALSYNDMVGATLGVQSDVDIRDSRKLLEEVLKTQFKEAGLSGRSLVALDCGAGVGRVTNELLLHLFHEVDLLEPSLPLLQCAREKLQQPFHSPPNGKQPPPDDDVPETIVPSTSGRSADGATIEDPHRAPGRVHRVVHFFHTGLEKHEFEEKRYDLIFIQWCLMYLTDEDLVAMLVRACRGLKPDGVIFVKENVCVDGFVLDKEDNGLTRSNAYLLEIFERAHLKLIRSSKQKDYPKELFEVCMYVLQPIVKLSGL